MFEKIPIFDPVKERLEIHASPPRGPGTYQTKIRPGGRINCRITHAEIAGVVSGKKRPQELTLGFA